jgi:aminotransferase
MNLSISHRSKKIVQSEIRAMSIECEKRNGINLSQGVCNLETPDSVKNGAKEAIDKGINHYTRYDGLFELRKSIARKIEVFNGMKIDPEKNIIVSGGATGAFYSACLALLNPGDEIIIFEPYYGYHVNTLLAAEAVPVFAKMTPPDWTINHDELQKLVTPRTKGIMINSPSNPSGKVFSMVELEALAKFSIQHDLFVFTDEIYEYFVYDGLEHKSAGALESIQDRTITISGYSKTFSITGWRIGYAICDEKWATMIGYINDLVYVCGPAPLQIGVSRGIDSLGKDYYDALCNEYYQKRNKICSVLQEIGLSPYIPQGAYYVLADVSSIPGAKSKEKAMYLLDKTGVASVPGSAFYHADGGENLVRFCFAKNNNELDEACNRLRKLKLKG